MNQVLLIGTIAAPPSYRRSVAGLEILSIQIAVQKEMGDGFDGCEELRCVVRDKRAGELRRDLRERDWILVTGFAEHGVGRDSPENDEGYIVAETIWMVSRLALANRIEE